MWNLFRSQLEKKISLFRFVWRGKFRMSYDRRSDENLNEMKITWAAVKYTSEWLWQIRKKSPKNSHIPSSSSCQIKYSMRTSQHERKKDFFFSHFHFPEHQKNTPLSWHLNWKTSHSNLSTPFFSYKKQLKRDEEKGENFFLLKTPHVVSELIAFTASSEFVEKLQFRLVVGNFIMSITPSDRNWIYRGVARDGEKKEVTVNNFSSIEHSDWSAYTH